LLKSGLIHLRPFPNLINYITDQWLHSFQDFKAICKVDLLQLQLRVVKR
jgi:hypothetical protein